MAPKYNPVLAYHAFTMDICTRLNAIKITETTKKRKRTLPKMRIEYLLRYDVPVLTRPLAPEVTLLGEELAALKV